MEVAERKGSTEFEYPVSQLIKDRRSRRAYANKPIELAKINSLFEAARWAPSSMNEQPWTYIYATKSEQPDLWNKMFNVLNERNQIWTKDVPLLVMSLARKNFTVNDRPNGTANYDMGAANAFLTLQATELGLNVHQMGGFDSLKARAAFNIPDTYDIGVIMAIGYPGNPDELPENLKRAGGRPPAKMDTARICEESGFLSVHLSSERYHQKIFKWGGNHNLETFSLYSLRKVR